MDPIPARDGIHYRSRIAAKDRRLWHLMKEPGTEEGDNEPHCKEACNKPKVCWYAAEDRWLEVKTRRRRLESSFLASTMRDMDQKQCSAEAGDIRLLHQPFDPAELGRYYRASSFLLER